MMTIRRPAAVALCAALAALLAGCAEDEEPKLPGERIPIRSDGGPETAGAAIRAPLPPAADSASWSHEGGDAAHSGGRRAGPDAGVSTVWTADAGASIGELAPPAGPVIADGRVFARDGAAGVVAIDAASGATLWRTDLTPEEEEADDGYGGGVAIGAAGTLYATTGHGVLASLDPADGSVRWVQDGPSPIRSAPAVFDNVAAAVDAADSARGYDAATGERLWTYNSMSTATGGLGGGTPAAVPGATLAAFGSGEIAVIRSASGVRIWSRSLGSARGGEGLSAFPDVTSGPVVMGGLLVASTAGGPLTAIEGRSGQELWSRNFGALAPVWPAGQTLYAVTSEPRLVRLGGGDGATLWSAQLEAYEDPEDREGPITWTGPVLAGNFVWTASSDGRLLGFDGVTGEKTVELDLPDGAAGALAAAGGTLYVQTLGGSLLALR